MWPLEEGVLVERLVGADSAYDGLPTLFSLLHPMDDLCPVTYRRPTASERYNCSQKLLRKGLQLGWAGKKLVGKNLYELEGPSKFATM